MLTWGLHSGISYVPTGFASSELSKLDEIIGGSAYGAGTVAGYVRPLSGATLADRHFLQWRR